MGYRYVEKDDIWRVEFRIDGKKKYFGSFKTENEAKIIFEEKYKESINTSLPDDISEFKDILEYDRYKISKDGRVMSFWDNKVRMLSIQKEIRGYCRVTICNKNGKKNELLHRLLYKTFIGDIPNEMVIDHIDRDKSNNRLENLRLVTASQNSINSDKVENAKGYHKNGSWWQAVICYDGERVYLGNFKTKKEAEQEYAKAKEKYHLLPQ